MIIPALIVAALILIWLASGPIHPPEPPEQ